MNQKKLIQKVAAVLRSNGINKPVNIPKKTFVISDTDGELKKSFSVGGLKSDVPYTLDDVTKIIEACLVVLEDNLKHGESLTISGYGSLKLRYRPQSKVKLPNKDEYVIAEGRYVPAFTAGSILKSAAKTYGQLLEEQKDGALPPPIYDKFDIVDDDDGVDTDG